MSFDFSKLGGDRPVDTLLDPRDIFDALPGKAAKYTYLRDVQGEVLRGWFERRTEKDVVLKMNTGAGKTVVGLLLLKSCLNEKLGPAAYFAPDNYLVGQAMAEAKALGVDVTDDPASGDFLRGRATLVTTISRLINGKSIFGVGAQGPLIELGSLLIDDAHACLATTEGQFTMTLRPKHPAYQALFALLRDDLHHQSPVAVLDLEAGKPSRDVLVPFTAWQGRIDRIRAVLHAHAEDDALKFAWPLLADDLPSAQATFGRNGLEIEMRSLPVDRIPSFVGAGRRIFMTATLPDDSLLVSDFDVSPSAVEQPVTPQRASDLGERMILAPQELNPELRDGDVKAIAVELAREHNVVVIVPSLQRASFWTDAAAMTLDRSNLEAGVNALRAGHVGLVVLVNRYDGVDLPDEACRVLIIDGLPGAVSQLEAVDASVLQGSGAFVNRQMQRIEQGMGRGVRSSSDHCVVFLMGSSLIRQLYAKDAKRRFTAATRAQLELGDRLEGMLRGQPAGEIVGVVKRALSRDPEWVSRAKAVLAGVKYDRAGQVNPVALGQRAALRAMRRSHPQDAARALQDVVRSSEHPVVRGWLKQQMAEYTNLFDRAAAQELLRSGLRDNPAILRPLDGITPKRLQTFEETQAQRVVDHLRAQFDDANKLLLEVNGLLEDLEFVPETAPAFEAALQGLAPLLGFEADRPEQETGRGPDLLWSLGGGKFLVIECKNGAVTSEVSKHDADQLSGSMNWFAEVYGPGLEATPVMVHPSATFGRQAFPHPETRVVTRDGLHRWKAAVRAFVVALASGELNVRRAGRLLVEHQLTPALLLAGYSEGVRTAK